MNGFLCFLLGISVFLNVILSIICIFIYKRIIKNNPLTKLSKIANIDREFWEVWRKDY